MDEKSADCDFDFNKVSTDLSRELVVEWKKKIHVVGTGRSCCFNRSGVDVSRELNVEVEGKVELTGVGARK